MADINRVPEVNREDFLARLDRAKKAGGYTEDSVHEVVDMLVRGTNTIIGALNSEREASASAPEATGNTAVADRLNDEARELFAVTSRAAAEQLTNAGERAEAIISEATTRAKETTDAAEVSAQETTDSANTWASEVRTSVQAEVEETRAAAERDLQDVRERRDHLAGEAADIVSRLEQFYTTQLDNLRAVADGSATSGSPLIAEAVREEQPEAADELVVDAADVDLPVAEVAEARAQSDVADEAADLPVVEDADVEVSTEAVDVDEAEIVVDEAADDAKAPAKA